MKSYESKPYFGLDTGKDHEIRSEERSKKIGRGINEIISKIDNDANVSDIHSFMRKHGRDLSVFAGDASLGYKTHNTPGINTAYFDAKDVTINIPESWLSSPEYTQPQLKWIQYHELSHFIDMRKNPDVFLDNFDQMHKDAENLARDMYYHHPKVSKNQLEGYFYEGIHALYNRLDDIYVNNLVGIKSPNYRNGEYAKSVSDLYIEKLGYSSNDIRDYPPHEQFSIALLQDEMVGDIVGQVQVSDEVEAVLSKKKLGKNIREIVDLKLKPTPNRLTDPKERYDLIRAVIQPEYIKLMTDFVESKLSEEEPQESQDSQQSEQSQESQESQESQQNQESQQSQQNQESQEPQDSQQSQEPQDNDQSSSREAGEGRERKNDSYSDFDFLDYYNKQDKSGEIAIDEETVRQILEYFSEQQKVDSMSPREREDYLAKKQQELFDKENQISSRQREAYEYVKARINEPRKKMRDFWKNLIGKSIEYESIKVNQQRRGSLNVGDFINNYAQITESQKRGDNRELNIYSRNELEAIPVEKPEKIEISLVVDGSGSMGEDRIMAVRETAELLMLSIKDFNDYLNQTRRQTKSKLRADTEMFVFGSGFCQVKTFSDKKNVNIEEADIIKSISEINSNYGGTEDHQPLRYISDNINVDQLHKISQQKLKKIVFHITDGGSNDPIKARGAVDSLIDEGVLAFAFQIGEVNSDERASFDHVWNSRSDGLELGLHIGRDVSNLPIELSKKLTEALKGIRL